jgi:hypothetical protein
VPGEILMAEKKTRDVTTLTVLGSQPMARPDGRAAIRLETRELGPIAFEVDQRAIAALRSAIAVLETHLRQKPGKA